MTPVLVNRLSKQLIGFKELRIAERARQERLALYPSLSSSELYGQFREVRAALSGLPVPGGAREARKRAWLELLALDVEQAMDERAVHLADVRTFVGDEGE